MNKKKHQLAIQNIPPFFSCFASGKLTRGLADTGTDTTSLLEVNVPALSLAGLVLESKGKDSVGLLDGVLALTLGAGEHAVDDVESSGGRELLCGRKKGPKLAKHFTVGECF